MAYPIPALDSPEVLRLGYVPGEFAQQKERPRTVEAAGYVALDLVTQGTRGVGEGVGAAALSIVGALTGETPIAAFSTTVTETDKTRPSRAANTPMLSILPMQTWQRSHTPARNAWLN